MRFPSDRSDRAGPFSARGRARARARRDRRELGHLIAVCGLAIPRPLLGAGSCEPSPYASLPWGTSRAASGHCEVGSATICDVGAEDRRQWTLLVLGRPGAAAREFRVNLRVVSAVALGLLATGL